LVKHKVLRIQMNPHFVFNALVSVQSYIMEENKDEALDYLSDIAILMRGTLDLSAYEMVSVSKDIEILNTYLKVQCRRYYHKIDCGVESRLISGSKFLMVPPLLVRPLIDAVFSEGTIRKHSCPALSVSYKQENGYLDIVVESKGVIMAKGLCAEEVGLIEERLELLQRTHKLAKSKIEYADLYDDGTIRGSKIRIRMPFINDQ
jgi:LytS/YehU family sensor histidine kinase